MPELPEVETICRGLGNLIGRRIQKVFRSEKKLRIDSSLDLQGLKGATILQLERRARYLLIHFSNKNSLILHLGMSGKITINPTPSSLAQSAEDLMSSNSTAKLTRSSARLRRPRMMWCGKKHDHFALEFTDGSHLIFNDPRRFGFVDLVATKNLKNHKMLVQLGVEPLSNKFNFALLRKKLCDKKMNIKTAMMDNKIVVGVGNIYINESLFDSGISPLRTASSLKENEIKKLVSSIKKILKKAIKLGGSSISDYVTASGNLGNFQNTFRVYGRASENCLHCNTVIEKIVQNGRSSFYCSTCQR
jgi:formamidopyrimidine-DNA glycosylase